jgi:hypothetical protein
MSIEGARDTATKMSRRPGDEFIGVLRGVAAAWRMEGSALIWGKCITGGCITDL